MKTNFLTCLTNLTKIKHIQISFYNKFIGEIISQYELLPRKILYFLYDKLNIYFYIFWNIFVVDLLVLFVIILSTTILNNLINIMFAYTHPLINEGAGRIKTDPENELRIKLVLDRF